MKKKYTFILNKLNSEIESFVTDLPKASDIDFKNLIDEADEYEEFAPIVATKLFLLDMIGEFTGTLGSISAIKNIDIYLNEEDFDQSIVDLETLVYDLLDEFSRGWSPESDSKEAEEYILSCADGISEAICSVEGSFKDQEDIAEDFELEDSKPLAEYLKVLDILTERVHDYYWELYSHLFDG